MNRLLNIYRQLPHFKGKLRLGKKMFPSVVNARQAFTFRAHHGIRYTIPNTLENIGLELLINGVYEKDVLNFILGKVKHGALVFDVGANIGSIGLPVCIRKKGIKYFGFEASDYTYCILQQNFQLNKLSQARLMRAAVFSKDDEELPFYESEFNGKNSFAPVYSQNFTNIKTISLDSFCRQEGIEQIDFMKVDVQGFELRVLEGSVGLLQAKKIKYILFEFEDWAETSAGFEPGSAQEFMLDQDYQLFRLNGAPILAPLTTGAEMVYAIPKHG